MQDPTDYNDQNDYDNDNDGTNNTENGDYDDYDYQYYYYASDYDNAPSTFSNVGAYDWLGLHDSSNMPDFSDFKSFVKFERREIIGNGHRKEDFIAQCVFDGSGCTVDRDFQTIQNQDFGNCFTFNSANDVTKQNDENFNVRSSTNTGFASGLKLSLFLDKDEYIGVLGQNSGARVTISNSKEYPHISTEAIYISAGAVTVITLKQEIIQREKHPFSNCTESWPDNLKFSNFAKQFAYTQDFCIDLCKKIAIVKNCNCSQTPEFELSDKEEIRAKSGNFCNPWYPPHYKCVQSVLSDIEKGVKKCPCEQPCKERVLNFVTSVSEWPTQSYAPYFARLLQRSSSKIQSFVSSAVNDSRGLDAAKLSEILRKNFARVEIHFEDLNFYKLQESPKYILATLFGTLGGNMGLWLGWSVLIIFEIFQWGYNCLSILFSRSI